MTININLLRNWKVKSDKHQFILVQEVNGRENFEGFYTTLEACLQAFIDKQIRSFDSTNIQNLLEQINKLQADLHEALRPLNLRVVLTSHKPPAPATAGADN